VWLDRDPGGPQPTDHPVHIAHAKVDRPLLADIARIAKPSGPPGAARCP